MSLHEHSLRGRKLNAQIKKTQKHQYSYLRTIEQIPYGLSSHTLGPFTCSSVCYLKHRTAYTLLNTSISINSIIGIKMIPILQDIH